MGLIKQAKTPWSRKGIALLITLFFIMAITVAIGVGLKQVNEASAHVQNEKLLLQTSMVFDDILTFLQTSKILEEITKDSTGDAFFLFLSQASFIPFETSGMKAIIELSSARSKFNINTLKDSNTSIDSLRYYMNNYMVNSAYVDMLLDVMGGVKLDESYLSDIFYEHPNMFRDYIVSKDHLNEINNHYMKSYRDNNLEKIDFDNLFYYSNSINYKIDVNYATPEVWEFMLGCDKQRAKDLSDGAGAYRMLDDLNLQNDEKLIFDQFKTSYYEPYIKVAVEVIQDNQSAKISFEYDLNFKRGYNFVYEI